MSGIRPDFDAVLARPVRKAKPRPAGASGRMGKASAVQRSLRSEITEREREAEAGAEVTERDAEAGAEDVDAPDGDSAGSEAKGSYRVDERLGRGMTGPVYRVRVRRPSP